MSKRHKKLLVWYLTLALSVMTFVAWMYCNGRWRIWLWEFVGFVFKFWVGWTLVGVTALAFHVLVDEVLAEYRLHEVLDRVTKYDDVEIFLRKTTIYLCWSSRLFDSLSKALGVPVIVVFLATGQVLGTSLPYDFFYPQYFCKYSNVAVIRRIEVKVLEHFGVVLEPDWLYKLRNVTYDERCSQEKFSLWLQMNGITRRKDNEGSSCESGAGAG